MPSRSCVYSKRCSLTTSRANMRDSCVSPCVYVCVYLQLIDFAGTQVSSSLVRQLWDHVLIAALAGGTEAQYSAGVPVGQSGLTAAAGVVETLGRSFYPNQARYVCALCACVCMLTQAHHSALLADCIDDSQTFKQLHQQHWSGDCVCCAVLHAAFLYLTWCSG